METTQTMVNTSVKNGVMTIELTFDPGNCYTHEMMRQIDEIQTGCVSRLRRVVYVLEAEELDAGQPGKTLK